MNPVVSALFFALVNLFHPRMLWLMVWPMLVSLVLWGTVLFFTGAQVVAKLAGWMRDWLGSGSFFLAWDFGEALGFVAKVVVFLAFVPLVWTTALLILSLFGMEAMVDHVAERRFPQLARRRGGSAAGSAWNGLVALAGLAGLCVLTLPAWLVPPLWPLIPVAIAGWLNQRVLRYDALAAHASADEMRRLFAANRGALYALGIVLALLAYVPLVGFVAPVLVGLAFIHLLLGALQALRQAPIEGEVVREARLDRPGPP